MFYVSRWGHLQTVDWLIRNLLPYLVFAAIVLFQADIRRALAHFGRAPFFRYFLTQEGADETIEEIAVAAAQLSAARTGAIVVVERQIGLRNYIEAGLPLDAMLTYDLLVSIFQPKSPLHDGAVIVQNDRVAAAACFLPLTVNPQLARNLGTRHRAAIGLTEENDAVAVIVSEETGRISVALDGRIEGPYDTEQPQAAAESAAEMSFRDHPFAHTWLKLVSVALAVLLWMMVSSQRASVERGLRIPLELQNLPENLEMVEPPQESVDVRVRGTADALGRITAGDLVASVDLSAAQSGRRLFHLSPERVKAPFAVVVTQVTPSSVAIRFEPSATRMVPVVPSVEGEPAPGFIVGKIAADPPVVEIIGPESLLRRVTEAITEPLWVGSARADVRSSVVVGVADEGVRLKSAKTADVSVAIVPAPEERQLSGRRGSGPEPVRWSQGHDHAAIGESARARDERVDRKLRESSVVAYVDLEGVEPGDYGLPVRLEPTADVGVDQLDPTIVSIHVE